METREPVVDEQGNPNKPKIDGTLPLPLRGRGKLVLGRKTKLAPAWLVCGFGGRLGKRPQESPRPAPLEPCEPVVGKSGGSGQPPAERKLVLPPLKRGGCEKLWKSRKEKADPVGPAKAAH